MMHEGGETHRPELRVVGRTAPIRWELCDDTIRTWTGTQVALAEHLGISHESLRARRRKLGLPALHAYPSAEQRWEGQAVRELQEGRARLEAQLCEAHASLAELRARTQALAERCDELRARVDEALSREDA